jgi:glycosyltransferase involved in cell wall biosynthesis
MSMNLKAALITKRRPHWQSLSRTEMFYRKALARSFEVIEVPSYEALDSIGPVAAVFDSYGNARWLQFHHPPCPVLTCIHGGAVLHHSQLRLSMEHMWTCDALIVNSTSDVAILRELIGSGTGPATMHIPLPVQAGTLERLERLDARNALALPDNAIVLGFVGRLIPQKNLHRFLTLIRQLRQTWDESQPVIGLVVGDFWTDYPVLPFSTSTYYEEMTRELESSVTSGRIIRLPGTLSDEELSYCYSAIDLLIHPTMCIDENFGYVPIEAMYCGTPVIGLAYGGLKDNIEPGIDGVLIPTWLTLGGIRADFSMMATSCNMLVRNPQVIRGLGERASASVKRRLNEKVCADRVCSAMTSSISRHACEGAVFARPAGSLCQPEVSMPVLPKTEPNWEYYMPAVAKYVSSSPPQVERFEDVTFPSEVELSDCHLRLLDPTWPAEYVLSPQELEIVEDLLKGTLSSRSGSPRDLAASRRVNSLIDRGGLVTIDLCII